MTEQYAYSTNDPAIVAVYRQTRAAMTEFLPRLRVDCAALGGNKGPLVRTGMWGRPDRLVALEPDGSGVIPESWRIVRGRLEPRRGKPGDTARAWLADHQPPDLRHALTEHGLPRHSTTPAAGQGFTHRLIPPALFELDDELWACYEGPPGGVFVADDGECTWTPRKLSEYYTARETAEARRHAEAVSDRG
jgi:hypothetical protein